MTAKASPLTDRTAGRLGALEAAPMFEGSADTGRDVVTGAFSYSGSLIASMLQGQGRDIVALTNHPNRIGEHRGLHPDRIGVAPLNFDDPRGLAKSMEGATTLFNTYWVRFAHGGVDHALAVENSKVLLRAAKRAGIRKIVHVSILNPSPHSPFPYFRGKAMVERAVAETGIAYTILRPSVLFDERGVLLNNIAWLLRKFPVFAVGGNGDYRVRPIHVSDLASLAVESAGRDAYEVFDAVGPDRPSFIDLVRQIRKAVGSKAPILRVPGAVLLGMSKVLGAATKDVLLTPEEYYSMADGLADSQAPATGSISLAGWLRDFGPELGRTYRNELNLHFK